MTKFNRSGTRVRQLQRLLLSHSLTLTDWYERFSTYLSSNLKVVKPVDLPVQHRTKFEFVINLKAAKQIGLTIPARVLERANKVIR